MHRLPSAFRVNNIGAPYGLQLGRTHPLDKYMSNWQRTSASSDGESLYWRWAGGWAPSTMSIRCFMARSTGVPGSAKMSLYSAHSLSHRVGGVSSGRLPIYPNHDALPPMGTCADKVHSFSRASQAVLPCYTKRDMEPTEHISTCNTACVGNPLSYCYPNVTV